MTTQRSDWRLRYELARSERDAQMQKELCERARRLIQVRSVHLAEANARNAAEQDELNTALRELWKLQNRP